MVRGLTAISVGLTQAVRSSIRRWPSARACSPASPASALVRRRSSALAPAIRHAPAPVCDRPAPKVLQTVRARVARLSGGRGSDSSRSAPAAMRCNCGSRRSRRAGARAGHHARAMRRTGSGGHPSRARRRRSADAAPAARSRGVDRARHEQSRSRGPAGRAGRVGARLLESQPGVVMAAAHLPALPAGRRISCGSCRRRRTGQRRSDHAGRAGRPPSTSHAADDTGEDRGDRGDARTGRRRTRTNGDKYLVGLANF